MHYFYILRCSDNSLYCGQTNNLQRRIKEHNLDKNKSAKYLRAKKPVKLVYFEKYLTLQEAMKREWQVKQWSRSKKEALIQGNKTLLKNVITLSERSESKGTKAKKEALINGNSQLLKKL